MEHYLIVPESRHGSKEHLRSPCHGNKQCALHCPKSSAIGAETIKLDERVASFFGDELTLQRAPGNPLQQKSRQLLAPTRANEVNDVRVPEVRRQEDLRAEALCQHFRDFLHGLYGAGLPEAGALEHLAVRWRGRLIGSSQEMKRLTSY